MHFDFVTEKGGRKQQHDPATKQLIRRRATQAAAFTKRKESRIKRTNSLHLAPWTINEGASSTLHVPLSPIALTVLNNVQINHYHSLIDVRRASSPPPSLPPLVCTETIPSLLCAPVIQAHLMSRLLAKFTLTTDHIRIGKLLKLSDPEFLSQLSAKYGQNSALDATIACLIARIKEFLDAPMQIESPRHLYGRALQTLHQSLSLGDNDDLESLWYATLSLALFELLDASSQTAWILHTRGAVKMLEHVGAANIVTEPQKTLLATQTPIMIIESIITANDCFLGEPDWQAAMANTIKDGPLFYFRSEMIVQLLLFAAKIPTLFNQVTDVIRTSATRTLSNILERLKDLKFAYSIWNSRWKDVLNHRYAEPGIEGMRIFYRANSYGYAAVIDRLLLSLDPDQHSELENAAVANAQRAAAVASLASPTGSVRLTFVCVVSQAIMSTSTRWREDCMFSLKPFVSQSVFLDWATAMMRPVDVARD
ncbi:hypothetical protein DV736_g2814, partial [Chaetothyriales sp. CBS 134916]